MLICRSFRILVFAILCLALCGCYLGSADTEQQPQDEIGLTLSGLNYTDMPIGAMYVNGSWGGGLPAWNGCCGFAGSVGLPYPWRPGTKVVVRWSDDELYEKDPAALYTAEVEVPPYGMIYSGFLWVAFYPGHVVKVYATQYSPGHPDFPEGLQVPKKDCKESPECREWLRGDAPPRKGFY